ncbi:MAG: ATP-dependent helicase/deoxyribonuclease subunit B [Candidatus Dichloromethanomonas elyunquensis]|nr:MAG: ATP-dependent helicase/deoxyribonuclease subunit B [Candidatus Dichloromethanomonas elyunquensis]
MKNLRFIYGRAGSGKTSCCLREIKERIEDQASHPLVYLVPEQYTFQAEKDLIHVLGTGGILKTEVLSFRRLAFRVFNQVGGITYPHIHSAGKCMLIYRILDKLKNEMKVFSKAADREGFVNTLSTLITEFKRYAVAPEELGAACDRLEQNDPLKEKLAELMAVYFEYEKVIGRSYRDSDDDLTLAAQKIPFSNLYEEAEIWIDGFAGFTPQEYLVIAKLLAKAKRINVVLCCDSLKDTRGNDVFASVKRVYQKLVFLAEDLGAEIEPPVYFRERPLPRFRQSPELSHLEQNLISFPYTAYPGRTGNVSLFSSVHPFAEVESAAGEIIRLCRDQGIRYKDIAVVTRNLGTYEKLFEVIFEEYGIPFFMDRKKDIINHPLVRLILSMLDIFTQQWSYEAVFRYLKTGLTGVSREDCDLIENYVLACGIRGSRWTKEEDWNDQKKDNALEKINQIRKNIIKPLLDFRQKTKGRKTAAEICGALYHFLTVLGVPEMMQELIDGFRKDGQLDLAKEYSQVWNIVMDVFDQTVEIMDEETVSLERFAKMITIGFAEYQVGLIPASLDQVLVGSVERSRSHEIKALFLLGVNDGVFPSSALEEGILSDQDRTALSHAGIELACDTRARAFDEEYLVYRVLTASSSYLRVSWPIADQEGRSLRPSIIISKMRKIFPQMQEGSDLLRPASAEEVELITGGSPSFRQMVAAIRRKAEGEDIHPLWGEIYRWFAAQELWRPKCDMLPGAVLYQNVAQPVNPEKISSLYGNPAFTSVSRLEKYAACPFAFYVQYGLGARERKIYQFSPPDVGTFMHAVIERFSEDVARQGLSWRELDRVPCAERVSAIVEEMLAKMEGSGLAASKRYTALTLRLKRVIARAVWLIAEHIRRSSFEPLGWEMGFGEGEKFPPITIELESGQKINLVGRIDRIDALKTEKGTYLRVVDYKSGAKEFKLADVFYGIQIQLITYLDALENRESGLGDPILPGGVLYFRIDDPVIRGNRKLDKEEIERAIMKELRMKGLLLADVRLIKEMDNTIDGPSLIIPARVNKGDVLGRSSAATLEQFSILRTYVRKLLMDLCDEIMRGNVSIKPYKKKKMTSCTYCGYSAVCQFDTAMKENTYRFLYEHEDETVWKLMGEKGDEQWQQ